MSAAVVRELPSPDFNLLPDLLLKHDYFGGLSSEVQS